MKCLISFFLLLFSSIILAASPAQPLSTDEAFQFSAMAKDYQTIIGVWDIKSGYYLYRDRIHFLSLKPAQNKLGEPLWPPTDAVKEFPGFGKLTVYKNHLQIPVPLINSNAKTLLLQVNYQGCSEAGYCYPPTSKTLEINLAENYLQPVQPLAIDLAPNIPASHDIQKSSRLFTQHNFFLTLLSFFIFGLLLSLTPCVLPMIPILSSIIVGQTQTEHSRGLGLSCVYVLGMATTYAIAGMIFGFIGGTLQAELQKPWIIVLLSLIFVAMALSLFGFYSLQLPKKLQNYLYTLSNRQKAGTYIGTAMMGCLATLILSPCVTPPLVGVLSYIGQTGNIFLGGFALFIMGIGMGVPLLIIGAFSAKLLPKAGPWMNKIKNLLGTLLLAVAIGMLARVIPAWVSLLLWAALMLGISIALNTFNSAITVGQKIKKILGIILFIYAILLIISSFLGNTDPLKPLNLSAQSKQNSAKFYFIPVKTLDELQQQLQLAQKDHQMVMVDFYADWCVSCKTMDRVTFSDPKVQNALSSFKLLRVDVTNNDADAKSLLRSYQVVAPPTLLFFNRQGKEISSARMVGEISATDFLHRLKSLEMH